MDVKQTILVVDDEPFFRQVLKDTLQEKYEVLAAADGEEASAIIAKVRPDLIILDVEMPGKNGIEICRELKGNFVTRDIPVIMLTSRTGRGETVDGLNAGADDYIVKPMHPPEVMARAETHLRIKGYYSQLEPKDLVLLLELSETISASRNPKKILHYIVDKIAEVIDVSRCSIVSINCQNEAVVKASSDMPADKEIHLDLDKYPEIKKALETKGVVVINDLKNDPMMEPVRDAVAFLDFNSVVVVPMVRKDSVIGTFFLRTASPLVGGISGRVLKLCRLMANISANALENAVLFESMKKAQFNLEQMAITDGLTGLYNHRHFYERLDDEFARAKRYGSPLSCIFIDLDDFKKVNDNYGHRKGDEVLRQIGMIIKEIIRESDIAARYGGEEFAILLPETGKEGAIETAERIHHLVRNHPFDFLEGKAVTGSFGVVQYDGNKISSPDQFIQLVDGAMYMAKDLGKDQVFSAN
ncbi:MAG: diguanylate cyclase [bacterium]|nr:diguanylate cyclase [bacterium]